MLDSITKKKIDDCRDVLVGKVPDPKSQIEQITLALIYKFMDDMDKESVEKFKGKAKFFTGEFAKYGWRKLFDPSLSGKEMLDLYSEALDRLQTNSMIPELFRNIFKNAFLPYKDPATLKMFLKHIDEFEYSHSEKLGDAFEYLLSVMGSQGDAGQFRTPRHIIDFITACVNPQKNETVADPACGTAGFLLSAYKHILSQNTDKRLGDKLTPDQRRKLSENLTGYDISPDMVRLSLVNMYLHGFTTPQIFEYDTLSNEDRWNETFDVILANPPFMTPKGGIRPHKKFGVQANKAEVLFTDYIAEHLTKNGRAGIVVPNGIISTPQLAYKYLRRMLVEDSLIAVISLPAGCFNPYSPVKTSVLLLDKSLSKKSDSILFIKISNDGYDLGAQRREIEKNDLPLALDAFNTFKKCLADGKSCDMDKYKDISIILDKATVLNNKDIVLNGDRYLARADFNTEFQKVPLGDVLEYEQPTKYIVESENYDDRFKIPVLTAGKSFILGYTNETKGVFSDELPVIIFDDFTTSTKYVDFPFKVKSSAMKILKSKKEVANIKYLFYVMQRIEFNASEHKRYWISQYSQLEIPLPPLEIQEKIVREIEGYQKIIDGAKMIVSNYKPTIKINPDWDMSELEAVCEINAKASDPIKCFGKEKFTYIDIESVENGTGIVSFEKILDPKDAPSRARRNIKNGDIALSTVRPNLRAFGYLENLPKNCLASTGFAILSAKENILDKFLFYSVHQDYLVRQMISKSDKGQYPSITANDVKVLNIYLPTLEEQNQIVQQIEQEQAIVNENKKMIALFEQKIKDNIDEIWMIV
jgi:type I restriction enzyme M protein